MRSIPPPRSAAGRSPPDSVSDTLRTGKGRKGSKGKKPLVSFPWGYVKKMTRHKTNPPHRRKKARHLRNVPILPPAPVFSLFFTGEPGATSVRAGSGRADGTAVLCVLRWTNVGITSAGYFVRKSGDNARQASPMIIK
jgi:hypothetical protein